MDLTTNVGIALPSTASSGYTRKASAMIIYRPSNYRTISSILDRDSRETRTYHRSFQIIALPIRANVGNNEDTQKEDDRLESLEVKGHGLIDNPS